MNRYEGLICPVCHAKLFEEDDVAVCPECGAPHHKDCYKKTGHCFYENSHGTENQWEPPEKQADLAQTPEEIRCPICGTPLSKDALSCTHCGAPVNQTGSKPFNSQAQNMGFGVLGGASIDEKEVIDGVTVKELAPFIGVNIFRYLTVFRRIAGGKKIGWNWAVFLIPEYWLCYRKCYLPGILLAILRLALMTVFALFFVGVSPFSVTLSTTQLAVAGIISILLLAILIVAGLFGDVFYKKRCYKVLHRLKDDGVTDPTLIAAKGGVSFIAPIILYFASAVIQLFIPSLF